MVLYQDDLGGLACAALDIKDHWNIGKLQSAHRRTNPVKVVRDHKKSYYKITPSLEGVRLVFMVFQMQSNIVGGWLDVSVLCEF